MAVGRLIVEWGWLLCCQAAAWGGLTGGQLDGLGGLFTVNLLDLRGVVRDC